MAGVVADTHAALWHLLGDSRLSIPAQKILRQTVQSGDPIYVASISLVEVIYLVEKKRLLPAALLRLRGAMSDPSFGLVPVHPDLVIADALQRVPRDSVPDLPDRVIAATALALNLSLVTRDGQIKAAGIQTIW